MTGNADGTFAPDEVLQRDQIAKIVLEIFNLFAADKDYCQKNSPFPDSLSADWSYQYICRGKELGMITGYLSGADAGFYRPGRSVNRSEFLALVLRNLNDVPTTDSSSYADVKAGLWYSVYAKYAFDNLLFTGTNLLPAKAMTRLEVAITLKKLHDLGKF